MSLERQPLVIGTNGEQAAEDQEAALLKGWSTPARVEKIGDTAFSLWKVEGPLPARPPRFSRAFYVAMIVGALGLIVLGRWVADLIRAGNFMAGTIFGVSLMIAMYGGLLFAAIATRRQGRSSLPPDTPPTELPPDAVACRAAVSRRGRSVGWLWFDGDRMCFQGAGFDFRLRREDFLRKGSLFKVFRGDGGASLVRPKGISEYRLLLHPGTISNQSFARDRSRWTDLEERFAAWESGSFTREPSLFPPIRPVPTTPSRIGWTSFVIPSLLLGGILGFAAFVLPIEPANGQPPPSPGGLALGGVLFGLLWPLMLWTSNRTAKSYGKEVDQALRRDGARS